MIVVVIGLAVLVTLIASMELDKCFDKEWLKPWGFRFTRYREMPQWERHYRWSLAIGPREYRRRAD